MYTDTHIQRKRHIYIERGEMQKANKKKERDLQRDAHGYGGEILSLHPGQGRAERTGLTRHAVRSDALQAKQRIPISQENKSAELVMVKLEIQQYHGGFVS